MIQETDLYLHRLLNEFADGLIKIFVPIIIYSETGDLTTCLVFVMGYYVVQSVLNLLLYRHMTRRPIAFMWLRMIPVLSTQGLLLCDLGNVEWIICLVLTYSLANVFYWAPLNYLFSKIASHKTGIKTGKFRAASIGGRMLAPLVSGYILTYFSIQILVITAITIYAFSMLILLKPYKAQGNKPNRIKHKTISPNGHIMLLNKHKPHLALFLFTYLLIGLFDTSKIFWSLYIYDLSINFLYVGIAAAAVQFGVLISNLISGSVTDKNKWFFPAITALVLFSFAWGIRAYLDSIVLIFLISAISGLLRPIFIVPFFANFIVEANLSGHVQRWIALREIALKTGGFLLIGTVILIGNILSFSFYISGISAILLIRQAKAIYAEQLKRNEQVNQKSTEETRIRIPRNKSLDSRDE